MTSQPAETYFRRYECSTCDKKFSSNSHLRRHEATHSKPGELVCPFCKTQFSRRDIAYSHVKRCSPNGDKVTLPLLRRGKKPTSCDTCAQRKLSCDANTPCTRCHSHGVTCTYGRLRLPTSSNLPRIADSSHSGLLAVGTRKQEPISVDFLLALTSPSSYHASTAVAADALELSSIEMETEHLDPQFHLAATHSESEVFMWESDLYSSEPIDYSLPTVVEEGISDRHHPETLALEIRMNEIVHELCTMHNSKGRNCLEASKSFSAELAQTVFTVANLRQFTWGYFHCYYGHLPIIHRPTFKSQTASLSLLLAIFLLGSLPCAPSDASFSTRHVFDVAEAYIFEHPIFNQPMHDCSQTKDSNDVVEILQAAMMLLIVQLSTCDRAVRQRIRLQRLPCFVAAIRSAGLFRYKHQNIANLAGESRWRQFIYDEVRVRLAAHTFVLDSSVAIYYNQLPQVAVSEMLGNLPCREDFFEAATAFDHERLLSSDLAEPSHSLADLISILFSESVLDPYVRAERRIKAADLLMAIFALQSAAISSKMNFLLPAAMESIIRASDRWKGLWDAVTQDEERRNIELRGFVKHAVELWWLIKMVVKVAQSGDTSCRYMRPLPSGTTDDLHDFIIKYKDGI